MPRSIFISHRHDDKLIADVFKMHFGYWNVPADEIFQSTDPFASTIIGDDLKDDLKNALNETRLVLLIFTVSDEDWSFCMWECGVATDPALSNTRVILFQAGEDKSRVFQDEVVFRLEPDDVLKFVIQFHTHVGFFLKDKAFQPRLARDALEKRAKDLYSDLRDLSLPGRGKELDRWDHFTLFLPAESANQIRSENDHGRRLELLQQNAKVSFAFGSAQLHFGYTATASNLSLSDLVTRWRNTTKKRGISNSPDGWIQELCKEMDRSIDESPAEPIWELMRSLNFKGDDWFYPILNHARALSNGGFEFEVYMYRFPGELPPQLAGATAKSS